MFQNGIRIEFGAIFQNEKLYYLVEIIFRDKRKRIFSHQTQKVLQLHTTISP